MNLFHKYNQALLTRPIITKSITGVFLFSLGDFLAQKIERRMGSGQPTFDYKRTAQMGFFGGCISSPFLHYWYGGALVRMAGVIKNPKMQPIAKVAIDQTAGSTMFLSGFFFFLSWINGDVKAGKEKLQKDLWPTLKVNWCIWPFIQMFNFSVVPVQFQVLTQNVASIFWNTYLSWKQFASSNN